MLNDVLMLLAGHPRQQAGERLEGNDRRRLERPERNLSALMLITTEVAEAAEEVRNDDRENFAEELADDDSDYRLGARHGDKPR